jgi:C_GCAxxG_C_C family probable redox protein
MGSYSDIPQISLPQSADWVARVRESAEYNMKRYESCSQSILAAFMGEFGVEDPLVMASAGGLHGGMMASLTCGIYTGGLMVLGLLIGRPRIEQGLDGMFPIIMPTQELLSRLKNKIGSYSCQELTGADFSNLNQAIAFMSSEDYEKCRTRVADGAEQIGHFLVELNGRGVLFRPDLKQA